MKKRRISISLDTSVFIPSLRGKRILISTLDPQREQNQKFSAFVSNLFDTEDTNEDDGDVADDG